MDQHAGIAPAIFRSLREHPEYEDPVAIGIVDSLNRPGGNITGVYQFTTGLEAKRLGLLREMVPKATTLAVLINPNFSAAATQLRNVRKRRPA